MLTYTKELKMLMQHSRWKIATLCTAFWSMTAFAHPDAAHVSAEDTWARASVPGQQASGAFMRLTAHEPLQLVGVETPAAQAGEIHEMKLDGDVMRMRAIDALDLPRGQTVELKPGGYHLMLQQLKAPLQAGSEVPLTLIFKDEKGEQSRLHLNVPVRQSSHAAHHGTAASATPASPNGHGH